MVLKIALLCTLCGYGAVTHADEQEVPDMEFLEYLGSWQGDDEEWLAVSDWDANSDAQGKEPEPPREEKEDE